MIISRISRALSNYSNLMPVFAFACAALCLIGMLMPPIVYHGDQLYRKSQNPESPLDPYERGGRPLERANITPQYPENSPYAGYVTAYLTPFSLYLASSTLYLGTTIVAHPGGILDEILYNTRGLDTVVESSILFIAFAIGSYIFRRR